MSVDITFTAEDFNSFVADNTIYDGDNVEIHVLQYVRLDLADLAIYEWYLDPFISPKPDDAGRLNPQMQVRKP